YLPDGGLPEGARPLPGDRLGGRGWPHRGGAPRPATGTVGQGVHDGYVGAPTHRQRVRGTGARPDGNRETAATRPERRRPLSCRAPRAAGHAGSGGTPAPRPPT